MSKLHVFWLSEFHQNHPVGRYFNSHWFINSFRMFVYENVFLVVLCTQNFDRTNIIKNHYKTISNQSELIDLSTGWECKHENNPQKCFNRRHSSSCAKQETMILKPSLDIHVSMKNCKCFLTESEMTNVFLWIEQ